MNEDKITVNLKVWKKNGQHRVYLNSQEDCGDQGYMLITGADIDYSNVKPKYLDRIKASIAEKLVRFLKEDEDATEAEVVNGRLVLTF